MKSLMKEPLVHFVLLGAALFAAFQWMSGGAAREPGRIVVTQGRIESLATGFTRTWQRPPTPYELEGLIREYVREEVCAREAIALGLDQDDTVIRRRLRQKLEFVAEDLAAQSEPSDEELRTYLREHPGSFHTEQRLTFRQVYLNPKRHGEDLAHDVAQMLAHLRQAGGQGDASALGDPFLLEHRFEAAPTSEVARLFGEKFATALGLLVPGQWHGPVESGYGAHLVLISERTEGRVPALEDVRDAVRREWANAWRKDANEKLYEALLERYTVTIEQPNPAEMSAKRL